MSLASEIYDLALAWEQQGEGATIIDALERDGNFLHAVAKLLDREDAIFAAAVQREAVLSAALVGFLATVLQIGYEHPKEMDVLMDRVGQMQKELGLMDHVRAVRKLRELVCSSS